LGGKMNFQELYDKALSVSEQKEIYIEDAVAEVLKSFDSHWDTYYDLDAYDHYRNRGYICTLCDPYDNRYVFCASYTGYIAVYNEEGVRVK